MRGSAVFRTSVTPGGALAGPWVRNPLWNAARSVPSLDLRFAENKSLVDATTGQNLVTFTRASSGTYVDSRGVIRTATTNYIRNSTMQGAVVGTPGTLPSNGWQVFAASGLTTTVVGLGTQNGLSYIDLRLSGTSTTSFYVIGFDNAGTSASAGQSWTESLWVSLIGGSLSNVVSCNVNLRWSGGSTTDTSFTPTASLARVSGTGVAPAGTTNVIAALYLNINSTSAIDLTLRIAAPQLEQSSTVGEYIPTTSTINSAPRFDHNPTTGESLGLLVEEQRTNLLLYSACDSNWVTGGFGTATYNLGLSALGVFSGVQIASAGQNWHSIYRAGISLTASTVYAFTLFYRAGTSGRVRLTFRNNGATTETLVNGSVGNLSVSAAFAGSATIISQYLCSDGLTYVVTGTFTPNNTNADHWYRIGPDSATAGQTVIALGAQLEAGSFPTSYIPTTTAAVTRSADVASITGSNFSSWYRQDEGTLYSDHMWMTTSDFGTVWGLDDGTANNETRLIGWNTGTDRAPVMATNGVAQINYANSSYTAGLTYRYAIALKQNDVAVSRNGVTPLTDNIVTLPLVTSFRIGITRGSAFELNGTIRRLTYWPQRLPDSTLQGVTQ